MHEAGREEYPLQPNCSYHQRRLTSRRLFERFARGKTHHVTYGDTSRRLCRHIMLPKGVHHVAAGNKQVKLPLVRSFRFSAFLYSKHLQNMQKVVDKQRKISYNKYK